MLSAEQFSEILAVTGTARAADSSRLESRRAPRITHPCRLTIIKGTSANAGADVQVQLKDISARGLCFLIDEPMARGTDFVVKLKSATGDTVSILSKAIRCLELNKHMYQIGAEFTCVLDRPQAISRQKAVEDLARIRSSILA